MQAEPGAGKTTRIPVALLEAGLLDGGELIVAQPRRLAARMAAARVASALGESVGERVGYQVRFDTKAGPNTQIRFVTEGILARRLRDDPELLGASMVILDEFHERHIHADVCLALLRRQQRSQRADLQIGVMSATLEPGPVAAYLGGTALTCPGRTHPVEVEFSSKTGERPLPREVASAVRRLAADGLDGSVLVFLPGAAEIRQTAEACEGAATHVGLEVVTLHGDLSAAKQDRAVESGAKPKLILATNVAETSITIEGVAAVIDSGLARRPSHNPWTGIPTLSLAKISRASAEQRAGRAGRTRAGRCLRLYSKHDFERRPAYDDPELQRLDLAAAMLDLRAAGIDDPRDLEWFEAPPEAAVDAAETLLRRLAATNPNGSLTAVGRAMLRFPTHPRLARLLVEARTRNIPALGAGAAALLSERPLRRPDTDDRVAAADVLVDLEAVEAGAARTVARVRDQLLRLMKAETKRRASEADEIELCKALLVAFVDRVGKLRGRELVFAEGGSATLAPECVVREGEYAVALVVEERRSGTRARTVVRSAAQVESDWILELFTDAIEERTTVAFDPKSERVEASEELVFRSMVLERRPLREANDATTAALREAALAAGPDRFVDDTAVLAGLRARTAFAHAHDTSIPELTDDRVRETLAKICDGALTFAAIRRADLLSHLRAELPQALDPIAPTHVTLAGGRRLLVHYELDRPPWVQSRLQDFFGSADGPTVARGRVPLVLHLLAPNRRAVQVTTDLAGFWERHYPELRRALMRRYPKHAWPDDPLTAQPPPKRRRR